MLSVVQESLAWLFQVGADAIPLIKWCLIVSVISAPAASFEKLCLIWRLTRDNDLINQAVLLSRIEVIMSQPLYLRIAAYVFYSCVIALLSLSQIALAVLIERQWITFVSA
jgi:hypothetical protein